MAVYQYYLAVIPKTGIKKRHKFIPSEIKVNTETGYFKSDASLYWEEIEKKADDIIPKLDLIVQRAEWGNDETSYNWKTYTEYIDNDASIYLDEETKSIIEFSFRADLRDNDLTFLKKMIELGKENEWMFMDRNGKLMKPDFEEIKISIGNSNAYSFLKDPIKFLKNIENKNK
jgi:hypothetical protein